MNDVDINIRHFFKDIITGILNVCDDQKTRNYLYQLLTGDILLNERKKGEKLSIGKFEKHKEILRNKINKNLNDHENYSEQFQDFMLLYLVMNVDWEKEEAYRRVRSTLVNRAQVQECKEKLEGHLSRSNVGKADAINVLQNSILNIFRKQMQSSQQNNSHRLTLPSTSSGDMRLPLTETHKIQEDNKKTKERIKNFAKTKPSNPFNNETKHQAIIKAIEKRITILESWKNPCGGSKKAKRIQLALARAKNAKTLETVDEFLNYKENSEGIHSESINDALNIQRHKFYDNFFKPQKETASFETASHKAIKAKCNTLKSS